MLIGQFENSVDGKGRMIVPAKFREDLGYSFVITRGLDGCIFGYPKLEWEALCEQIRGLPMSSGRDIQRFFFANAEKVTPDGQGRILIPTHLRDHAGIDKDTVVIGSYTRIEIWDRQKWENQCAGITNESVLAALDQLPL